MALTDYLHGVDWINDPNAITPVEFPRSGVIGLIGTAPIHLVADDKQSVNKPISISSYKRALEYFGPADATDYSLPKALEAVYLQGVSLVVVINVFDPTEAAHYTEVSDEAIDMGDAVNEVVSLANTHVWDVVVTNVAGDTTYVLDTDYKLDAADGTITRLAAGAIADDETIHVDYKVIDPTGIDDDTIIGELGADGVRTGLQAFDECFHLFGYNPRLLAAPEFSYSVAVTAALGAAAERLLAHAAVDAPVGATVAEVIAGRNDATGTVTNFATADPRTVLCYPHLVNGRGELVPMSAYWVGVAAMVQNKYGYHWSPSNKHIRGVAKGELALTSTYTTSNSDIQLLNEVGVVTVFGLAAQDSFAAGYRIWGNRTAAYPSSTSPQTFIVIQIIEDQLRIGIEQAMLQYIDRPINQTTIGFILQTINLYIGRQKSMRILIGGKAFFQEDDNPADQLALGHVIIRLNQAGPPPLERLTIMARYDEYYLWQLSNEIAKTEVLRQSTTAPLMPSMGAT
jgi:phage tail sheath protein FI